MQRECALQSFSPNQFKLTFWLDVQTDKQILSKSQNSLSLNLTYNFLSAIYITMKQCDQSVIGNRLLRTFVKERRQTAEKSIWDVVKKRKLLSWKTTWKTVRVAANNKIIELKEDRCLFVRMMIICKSRLEIDIKEALGVRVLGSSTINVCRRWQYAALFRKERLDEYSREAAK